MTIEGVDYAFSQPSASALKAAGKVFACRYGGPGSAGKHLTATELAGLKARGIAVVANAEGAAGGFSGFAAGRAWAQQAKDHFGALGMPAGRPIYFSVDWNAGASDWAGIDAACKGAASVIGADQVGVYGGYNTIAHCVSARTARWFWQTYAWSGGKWHPAAHIQQYRNGMTVGGAQCDLNRAMTKDYGQWGVDDMPITDADAELVADKVWGRLFARPDGPDAHGNTKTSAGAYQSYSDVQPQRAADRVIATLAPLIKGLDVDEAAIARAVLSGLPPAVLSDAVVAALSALPAETAKATADEIAARMSAGNTNG